MRRSLYALALLLAMTGCGGFPHVGPGCLSPKPRVQEASRHPGTPPPPSPEYPPLDSSTAVVVCPACPDPLQYAMTGTAPWTSLRSNEYIEALREGGYSQDADFQEHAAVHFDNCAFAQGSEYIEQTLDLIDVHIELAGDAAADGNTAKVRRERQRIFHALGRVLHTVQDFYAHSNYVELMQRRYASLDQVPVLQLWTPQGRQALADLASAGLLSGHIAWSTPARCDISNSIPHALLAKHSAETTAGKLRIAEWRNITQFEAASHLARRASADLLSYAYKRWPVLGEIAGPLMAFEIFQERRRI